jgi:hypothetical protein
MLTSTYQVASFQFESGTSYALEMHLSARLGRSFLRRLKAISGMSFASVSTNLKPSQKLHLGTFFQRMLLCCEASGWMSSD